MTIALPRILLAGLLGFAALAAQAQLRVETPTVRPTVPEQKTTGAFMTLTSAKGGTLVSVSSPAAEVVQIHEMKMAGDVMKMREISTLALPAGVPVQLKPGAYHMMLMGLKTRVNAGDAVPLRLVVEDAKGNRETVDVQAVAK